jgi:hypothetical protein
VKGSTFAAIACTFSGIGIGLYAPRAYYGYGKGSLILMPYIAGVSIIYFFIKEANNRDNKGHWLITRLLISLVYGLFCGAYILLVAFITYMARFILSL